MAPQAVAEPALPVLPSWVSKHPTKLTHRPPVSLPPTAPATPSVSLSFSTDTSTASPLPSAGSALSLQPPTRCGSAPSGRPASLQAAWPLPDEPPSPAAPRTWHPAAPTGAHAGCWTPAHPPGSSSAAPVALWLGGRGWQRTRAPHIPPIRSSSPLGGHSERRCPRSQGGQQSPELADSAVETQPREHLSPVKPPPQLCLHCLTFIRCLVPCDPTVSQALPPQEPL